MRVNEQHVPDPCVTVHVPRLCVPTVTLSPNAEEGPRPSSPRPFLEVNNLAKVTQVRGDSQHVKRGGWLRLLPGRARSPKPSRSWLDGSDLTLSPSQVSFPRALCAKRRDTVPAMRNACVAFNVLRGKCGLVQ